MFNSVTEFGRKFLMGLAVVAGTMAASDAGAAVRVASPVPVLGEASAVQPVQYYDDWRAREWHRREAFERFQRREARREWRHAQREYYGRDHGRGYGRGHGGGYGGGHGQYYGSRW